MSEISETLYPGESIVFRTRPSRITKLKEYAAGIAVAAAAAVLNYWQGIILAAIPFVLAEVSLMSLKYYYTNDRVIEEKGILSKNWTHIFYDKITDVMISKGALGRFVDIGNVVINTAGSDTYEMVIRDVNDPESIQRYLLNSKRSSG